MELRKAQEVASYKYRLSKELEEMITQEASNEEMIDKCQQHILRSNNSLGNVDIAILVSSFEDRKFLLYSGTSLFWTPWDKFECPD